MKRRGTLFIVVTCLLLLMLLVAAASAMAAPKRVLVVVMDQMHPQYAQQYHMNNVLWLEKHGAWFPNAYVGDMASETVVSHNVMVSGLFPKHMGWSDEAFRDTNNVLGSTYGGDDKSMYVTGDLGYSDFVKLVTAGDYPKLGTYLQAANPTNPVVACIGEKNYQVRSMLAGTNPTDTNCIGVFLGSGSTADPALVSLLGGKYRPPSGVNVPAYISADPANRFVVNSDPNNDYGTLTTAPAWIYPEDGDRMVPGMIEGHQGGDDWVADTTIKIMQNENWSGLFVNFGAIDKIGHMWGSGEADTIARYGWDPTSKYNQVHEPFIAKNADTQLGRLIGSLKALGEFKDTLIVVIADHGSTYARHFYGNNAQNAGDYNWYYGNSANDGNYYATGDPSTPPPPAIAKFDTAIGGNIAFTYQSTAIETWLTDFTMAKKQAAALYMRAMPGVIATYIKADDGSHYTLDHANVGKMTMAEYAWWKAHGKELVNTMCWPGSADVVGLLKNQTSYGAIGDHGGAQKDVQRIPMVFYNPSLAPAVRTAPARLVDLMPTIMKTMDLTPTKAMDGKAYTLKTMP
jgi:hypothetical protein